MLVDMTVPYSSTVITENAASSASAGSAVFRGLSNQPLLLAGLGAATISASPIFVVLSSASPVSTAFYRSLIALPVLVALAAIERRRHGNRSASQRLRAVAAGVFLGVDLILWTHAIANIGAGVATILGNLQVLIVAGLAWLIWHERPGRAVAFALPVVMLGVVLVSGLIGKPVSGQHPLAGIGYGLAMSFAYACYLMMLRRSSADSAHVAGPVADATAGATVTSLVIGLIGGGLALHPIWPALGWLTLLALISQVAGWLLITSSLPRLPAAVASLMLLLQPAASLGLAALILGERPTLLQILGAALTCIGALAASLATTRSVAARAVTAEATALAPGQTTARQARAAPRLPA
jgi:drug/metabolite transporter (DMT)-like permease